MLSENDRVTNARVIQLTGGERTTEKKNGGYKMAVVRVPHDYGTFGCTKAGSLSNLCFDSFMYSLRYYRIIFNYIDHIISHYELATKN